MSYAWQTDTDTVDLFECQECGTAWDTREQAEFCGEDDRAEERFERTCDRCDTVYPDVRAAEECEAGHFAEQASDRT